ncbi:AAA family ATPase [Dactylosporangium sp. CA-139066]|uniref:helix-turn-helix transcriptional regulator n=1 Tax=Dactylosporangium sp. CA-139066 TaxID=3239930 RepID=UPI003D8BB3FD
MTVAGPSGRPSPAPPHGVDLLGRSAELEAIDALLAGRAGGGLLLRGEPGVGRTALLDAAEVRAAAAGARVLRASCAPFEARMRFSALHQMLYPVRETAQRLPGGQRDALADVFGQRAGPPAGPLVTATAVLELLNAVAADRPLLVLVDDLQCIDDGSAAVLGFLARRIADTPVRLVASVRCGAASVFDEVRLPERTIGPLAPDEAATLLDNRHPGLPGIVRRRLLADAAGNPLALVELPSGLTDRQRSGRSRLPAFLPLNARLETTFGAGLADLTAPVRRLLLLAALDAEAGMPVIRAAAQRCGPIDNLSAARRAGLVRLDAADDRPVFRHPLVRAAVVQLASADERRAAHAALAEALAGEPDRRAWHLAATATGPDETLARALDDAALAGWRGGSNRPRSSAAWAVGALVRAGELSTEPSLRARRLVDAAFLANVTGQLDQVPQLLVDAGQAPDNPTGLVFAAAAHLLTNGEGDVDAARRLLTQALDEVDGTARQGRDSYGILHSLLFVSIYSDSPESWGLLGAALSRFDPDAVTPLQLCYDAYADPARTDRPVRQRIAKDFEAFTAGAPLWGFIPVAWAALQVDALGEYRHLCQYVIDRERDGGVATVVIAGLLMLSADSIGHGRWDEGERLAREALELAVTDGYQLLQGHARCRLALIEACRGNTDRARAMTDEVGGWATPRGVGLVQGLLRQARVTAALGRGDYEDAFAEATRICPSGATGAGVPGRWMVLDVVEAAVRVGRLDLAREHVAAARRAGIARISPRTMLLTTGAAALSAPDAEARELFESALSLPDADQWPFERARIQLAYGQWLRRNRDTARARRHLREALESLDRLGARSWAVRAGNELRAAGVATARRRDAADAALTPQERRIAALAATGLTNKQIGERLFLSPRTVGAHLHRLFPKLGITSRAALRGALETTTPHGRPDPEG